jgi:phosphatidylserine decarboxylase
MIRKEAYPWALSTGIPALIFYGLWIYYWSYWFLALFIVGTAATVFFLYFFRDPDREPEFDSRTRTIETERHWLAPADGIVTGIEEEDDGRTRLIIFLTVFNVHVNRMPVSGTICGVEYRGGQFLPAFADDLEKRNERNRVLCRDSHSRPFEVWQIAGLLARRIHFWKNVDDPFSQGERFGMISLGSRTDLIVPEDVRPVISVNETVRGGQTVVGRG